MIIRFFFMMCALALSSCAPLLSPETQHHLSHVFVEPIPERSGQKLRHLLTGQFKSYPHSKTYSLKVSLSENSVAMELGVDAKANLEHVLLTATYELKHILTGKIIDKGQVTSSSSKTLTTSYYSRTTADQYILDNNISNIQRLLIQRIAKALSQKQEVCDCPTQ